MIVASYDADGRFLGSVFITGAGAKTSVVKSGAKTVSIFWLDQTTQKPLCAPEKVSLT